MRPSSLKTRIFLDSGDPEETRQAIELLGFLDGQTTNPSLVSKNPKAKARIERGDKFILAELLMFYKTVVQEISRLIPQGSVSIEVYADKNSTLNSMFYQGQSMFSWIPNAHIKYPITSEGISAAIRSLREDMRVNMTLCFSQEQAAAVSAALGSTPKGNAFVSPFVGRLDDIGLNGMMLVQNIIKMYREANSNVEVLTASVRNLNHLLYAMHLGSDIVTAPFKVLKEWAEAGLKLPSENCTYAISCEPITYKTLNLGHHWTNFNISHQLTDAGIKRFSADWISLLK